MLFYWLCLVVVSVYTGGLSLDGDCLVHTSASSFACFLCCFIGCAVWLLSLHIQVDFQLMEIVRPSRRSIRRSFHPGVYVQYASSAFQSLSAKINAVQVSLRNAWKTVW